MLRLAIIRELKIVENTVRFSISRKDKKTMDRVAIIQEHKILETMVGFSISRKD